MKEKIEHLLRSGFELKASDIHITVGIPPVMRINGDLRRYGTDTITPDEIEEMARASCQKIPGMCSSLRVN